MSSSTHLQDIHESECYEETDVDVCDEEVIVRNLIPTVTDTASSSIRPVVLVHRLWKKFVKEKSSSFCRVNCCEEKWKSAKKVEGDTRQRCC